MTRGKILLAGAVANKAGQGGEAWVRLNWLLGLRQLGFDVHFVEQLQAGAPADAADFFNATMQRHGLAECATLLDGDNAVCGPSLARVIEFATDAEALVNISGHLTHDVMGRVKRRVYVDIDPGFTQIWHLQGAKLGLENHDTHFTIGANIGTPECAIPTCGFAWKKVRPPVLLDAWPVVERAEFDRFTTIANWRGSYGALEFEGRTLGLKVHEFRKCIALPRATGLPFEIALSIHPGDHKDRAALVDAGWRLIDPASASETADAFQKYVRGSGAEFSVAQGVYVHTRSGWFSDRTAVYLASGRPALVQDTGFSRHLPSAKGLVAFSTPEEAAHAAREIVGDYAAHCRKAREVAEEFFDSRSVLGRGDDMRAGDSADRSVRITMALPRQQPPIR
jgi:hypothetical protein